MKQLKRLIHYNCLLAALGLARLVCAEELVALTEKDYLDEVPIVLSVSRLPQRLDETPGAVTILDRQMIRMSGARDVADLLRLVPGFWVNNAFEANAPEANYHGIFPGVSNRMQVLVDGRAVYSPFYFGSSGPGLQTVPLDDIERIEVHRGSNSSSYGARALLGVIHIYTRDLADTQGTKVHVAAGDNNIQDASVRHGWAGEASAFRLGVDQRADANLSGSSGPVRISRMNFQASFQLQPTDQLEVRLGQTEMVAGTGFANQEGNAPRNRYIDTNFLQLDWRRSLEADADLHVQFSRTDTHNRDRFVHLNPAYNGLVIDATGRAVSDSLSLQHGRRVSPALRWVVGGELRSERVSSRPLYDTDAAWVTNFSRVFGNAEWRLNRQVLLNLGALAESSNDHGESFASRAMLHWRPLEQHAFRYGVSQSFRPPSTYELHAKTVYRTAGWADTTAVRARPGVINEKITSTELGYLGTLTALDLSFDLRLFNERIRDFIKDKGDIASGGKYYANDEDFSLKGLEYQLKWKPWSGADLMLHQSFVENTWTGNADARFYATTGMMATQKLDSGIELSLLHSQTDPVKFAGEGKIAPAYSRTDVRIAAPLRLGSRKGEVSFVVQNLTPAYQDYLATLYFRRQAYLMFRLEN